MVPKLEIQGLRKVVTRDGSDPFVIFQDIHLRIGDGEFVTIVGPSGCGKTTLLKVINGLLPPTEGRILIDGRDASAQTIEMGFVFQSASLLPWRTGLQNVQLGLEAQRVRRSEAADRALHYFHLVGLKGFEHHYPHELSGGMQQRINLARALAVEPQILLMDEPFASLDSQTRDLMQVELLKIWAKTRKTVLFVTHMIAEAILLADRVIVLSNRPGMIRAEVRVDLPRPRSLEMRHWPRFIEVEGMIWKWIEEEVRKSFDYLAVE